MTKKSHHHMLKTNPQHHEEEIQNTNSQTIKLSVSKAASSLFLSKMISKLCGKATTSTVYCKFRIFHEGFIFKNSVKRHACHVKNSLLRYDLPVSVNNSVISPLHEDLIFTKLGICKYKTLAKISEFTVTKQGPNAINYRNNKH